MKREKRKEKGKKKPFPGWAESSPNSPPPLFPARSSPPPEAQLGPPPARARAAPTVSPAPPVSHARPRSLATALSLAGGPCLSAPSPSPVIRLSARSLSATAHPVASPLTRSLAWFGALRHHALCLSRPVATSCPSRPVATVCHYCRGGNCRRRSPPLLPPPSHL
jgi:hypothetical protein